MSRAKGQLTKLQMLGHQSLKEAYPMSILTKDDVVVLLGFLECWRVTEPVSGQDRIIHLGFDYEKPRIAYGESNYARVKYKLENCLSAKAISL